MENTTTVKRKIPWYAVLPAGLALLAILGLLAGLWRYDHRFLPRTAVAGVDVSSLTAEESAQALYAAAQAETVTLRDSGGEMLATLPLSAFMEEDKLPALMAAVLSQQQNETGALGFLSGRSHAYAPRVLTAADAATLERLLAETMYADAEPVPPRDARLILDETGYTVIPEETGTAADLAACARALEAALSPVSDLTAALSAVEVEGGLLRAEITRDSFPIDYRVRKLEQYLSTGVTLDFGNGNVYTLSPEDIWAVSTVSMTPTSVKCVPDSDLVHALADRLADEYASEGVYAKFLHAAETRELIYYRVGDDGWLLDRQALGDQVLRALETGEETTVVPDYDYTWYWKSYYPYYRVGDTFVEISLDNQYLWYFVDGELLVETPVVTGDLAKRDDTRKGCFRIYYKDADTYLQGTDRYGSWNDHVDYWLPFDGGIGLHDSSWRDEYGGEIYFSDGSHGCVNTPLDAMRIIYENISAGDVVIVY